ncbi:hypothetical protein A2U01_0108850 [Trifolium medium]|uniref:Uncharacterized protein n=1 Tax=Trifolium medium TaxID=97028 RepID=A0A392VGP1_9FABA|nr:hypothetical protein [Trifolium medium]
MIPMVLRLGLRALKESLGLCDVRTSIECCWVVTFSMRKLIIDGETRSKGWELMKQ